MQAYAASLEGVFKWFTTERPAIADIDLTVEQGEILTLIGPSGCGKTTTLRLIAGLETANGGAIRVNGKMVDDGSEWIPPERRSIGMVFQDYALFPHLRVKDNIGFGYEASDRREKIMRALQDVHLDGLEDRYPHELSGGQQQRVALGRALLRRPSLILLDEPFSNLDPHLRRDMQRDVSRILRESGAAAILVTHDHRDALAVSDSVAIMSEGNIVRRGTPREVYTDPRNEFSARFLGRANIIDGRIQDSGTRLETPLGAFAGKWSTRGVGDGPVRICLRPESLRPTAAGPIRGEVVELAFLGDRGEAILDLGDEFGAIRLEVDLPAESTASAGDEITVAVDHRGIALLQ